MAGRCSFKLPEPGGFATLGTVYRLSYRAPSGAMTRYEFGAARYLTDQDAEFDGARRVKIPGGAPVLLWAPDVRALYIFPGFKVAGFRKGTIPERAVEAAQAFNAFDRGAKASGGDVQVTTPNYPQPTVTRRGTAFDIVYRSEKWNGRDGERVDYNHHFSKSGAVEFFQGPGAMFIQGGRLTVNDRGIVY